MANYYKTFYNPKSMMDNINLEELDRLSDDFLLSKNLNDTEKAQLKTILALQPEQKSSLENVFVKSAELANRSHNGFKLYNSQIDPVLMSYVAKRFFIADSPGLGKTIEAGGVYAYYRLQQIKNNLPVKKVIVVAENIHVLGFKKMWDNLGINLLPLYGGNANIKKDSPKFDLQEHDGVVLNWDSLKTNEFALFWLQHYDEFNVGIFDETSCLRNPKSALYRIADTVINNYQNGLERVVFLNGTPFERELYDYYYQFNVLVPKLIPSKTWLDGRYVLKEGKQITLRQTNPDGSRSLVHRNTGEIVDYRNQEELKERLALHMLGRSKQDFSKTGSVPSHSYILHLVDTTKDQRRKLEESKHMSLVNSPQTANPNDVLTQKTSPKLKQLVEFAQKVINDRPMIYVRNIESQKTIAEELTKLGMRVAIINGSLNVNGKEQVVKDFEEGYLDVLVFNIKKSLSIKTSERIIFYDIPEKPSDALQISARIDRDNYDISKFYDFFCYKGTPEMINMVEYAYFRESNSNKFTGKDNKIFEQLVEQLVTFFGIEKMREVTTKIDTMYEQNKEFTDVQGDIENLLNI